MRQVNFFVCYAHEDQRTVSGFLRHLGHHFGCAKGVECKIWNDPLIPIGEDWDKTIKSKLDDANGGIILVSPAILASKYSVNVEFPKLMVPGKVLIPVALKPISFSHHEMHGLEKKQIFFHNIPTYPAPKSYSECSTAKQKEAFVSQLFAKLMEQVK